MVFVKTSQKPPLKGVRVSPHHLVPCVSSGVPSLDTLILGGGLPVGYWLSISSDQPPVYAKLFPQFFLSEGAEMEQTLFIAGRHARSVLQELPQSTDSQEKAAQSNEKLQIAWAYQNKPALSPTPNRGGSSRFGHYWDVSTTKNIDSLKSKLYVVDTDDYSTSNDFIQGILDELEKCIDAEKDQNRILRVCLLDCGGALWPSATRLSLFLLKLRGMCTLPHSCLFTCSNDSQILLSQFSDVQLKLSNFLTQESQYRDQFDGTIDVAKLIQVGLRPFQPSVKTFGFKLKRKKFNVEPLHLPPDFDDGKTRDGDDTSYKTGSCNSKPQSTGCCGSSGSGGTCDF